jgi:hypothetical protein
MATLSIKWSQVSVDVTGGIQPVTSVQTDATRASTDSNQDWLQTVFGSSSAKIHGELRLLDNMGVELIALSLAPRQNNGSSQCILSTASVDPTSADGLQPGGQVSDNTNLFYHCGTDKFGGAGGILEWAIGGKMPTSGTTTEIVRSNTAPLQPAHEKFYGLQLNHGGVVTLRVPVVVTV